MIPIEELRELCKKRNSSIKQMEEELGIGNGVIAKWYKRGTDPAHSRLQQIADYLSVSIEYLATGEEKPAGFFKNLQIFGEEKQPSVPEGLSEKDQRLIAWFRSLPEEKQKAILILQGGPEDAL